MDTHDSSPKRSQAEALSSPPNRPQAEVSYWYCVSLDSFISDVGRFAVNALRLCSADDCLIDYG